ncbi:MAG: hypothetical protein LAQ69_31525 [Acidobacteriia bacterium]|nr:hypothetical protein [Terriglobia bacterium]
MKHHRIAQWVDFARALVPEDVRVAMLDHLADGCSECRQVAEFSKKLVGVCRGMAGCDVPDSAVRRARAIIRPRLPAQPKRWARIPAELIFDSFLAPSPIGLRSTWQVGWQALYRAGDCSVDLRVEPDLSSSRAAVIGQISNHVSPNIEMADIPVCVKQGKFVLAEARSNRFGEFQMEYEQQGRTRLCIYLDGGSKRIQVPLRRLATDRPARAGRLNPGVPAELTRSGSDSR